MDLRSFIETYTNSFGSFSVTKINMSKLITSIVYVTDFFLYQINDLGVIKSVENNGNSLTNQVIVMQERPVDIITGKMHYSLVSKKEDVQVEETAIETPENPTIEKNLKVPTIMTLSKR